MLYYAFKKPWGMTFSGTHQDLLQNLLRNFQSLPDLLRNLLQNPGELARLCTKASQTFSGTFSRTLMNLAWLCTRTSQTFSGTFSGTLMNLAWLCTFSGTFSGTFSRTLLNLTWPCTLLRNLLRNPVEPDLALHQSLPDLLQNLLRNPVELDLALHQSLPEPSPELLNLTRLCTKASQTFSGTFSGTGDRRLLINPINQLIVP